MFLDVLYILIKFHCTAKDRAKRFIDTLEKDLRNNTLWKLAEPKLNWHVLCNVKERKKFTRLLQNKFNARFELQYTVCFDLSRIDRHGSSYRG